MNDFAQYITFYYADRQYRNFNKCSEYLIQKEYDDIVKNIPLSTFFNHFTILTQTKNKYSYYGNCPICKSFSLNNKASHFVVTDKKRLFKCFNCGYGGMTPIGFLKQYYNINTKQAITFLNQKFHNNKYPTNWKKRFLQPKFHGNIGEVVHDNGLPF